jgi:hypothetical protein
VIGLKYLMSSLRTNRSGKPEFNSWSSDFTYLQTPDYQGLSLGNRRVNTKKKIQDTQTLHINTNSTNSNYIATLHQCTPLMKTTSTFSK